MMRAIIAQCFAKVYHNMPYLDDEMRFETRDYLLHSNDKDCELLYISKMISLGFIIPIFVKSDRENIRFYSSPISR